MIIRKIPLALLARARPLALMSWQKSSLGDYNYILPAFVASNGHYVFPSLVSWLPVQGRDRWCLSEGRLNPGLLHPGWFQQRQVMGCFSPSSTSWLFIQPMTSIIWDCIVGVYFYGVYFCGVLSFYRHAIWPNNMLTCSRWRSDFFPNLLHVFLLYLYITSSSLIVVNPKNSLSLNHAGEEPNWDELVFKAATMGIRHPNPFEAVFQKHSWGL